MSGEWLQGLGAAALTVLMTAYGWWWGTRDERRRASRWRGVYLDRVTTALEDRRFRPDAPLALTADERLFLARAIDGAAEVFERQAPRLSRVGGDTSTQSLASRHRALYERRSKGEGP